MSAVLKLVQAPQFTEQVDVDPAGYSRDGHSLQSALSYAHLWQAPVVRYVVDRFSSKGDTVLDTSCASGASGVECLMLGRHFLGCAEDPAFVKLARARLSPADIAEVVLHLQFINLKRPVDVREFSNPFPLYFDVDTFCELMNLRAAIRGGKGHVDAFIEFIVASILHGHTVAHLSGYSSPHGATSPTAQATLNRKRGEVPSYRAVPARIIKKAAALLRDGIPTVLQRGDLERLVHQAPMHDMAAVRTASVNLALVCPLQPGSQYSEGLQSWLRSWWLGVEPLTPEQQLTSQESWADYVNGALLETARVVRKGGRTVVRVGRGRLGTKPVNYREELSAVLQSCLSPYWTVEGTIVERYAKSAGLLKGGSKSAGDIAAELVVLRRK
jgi:hypothetical protein